LNTFLAFVSMNMSGSFLVLSPIAVSFRDPIPVPEKVRRPLTQVQEFNLHVDHRAVDRADFDQKVPKIIIQNYPVTLERHSIFSTEKKKFIYRLRKKK
jgi:targeting protein for Xklp2